LSNKEKKKLNGEVRIFSMYDEYKNLENCNLDEILNKDDNTIKNILTVIKANNTCSDICSSLSISNGKLYELYKEYGVEYKKKPVRNKELKLEDEAISIERFSLMDSLSKGKYIVELIERLNISISTLAKFWDVNKNSLSYYIGQYRKKLVAKSRVKSKSLPQVPSNVIKEIATDTSCEPSNEDLLNKKILELEGENRKLIDNIISISKDNNENRFKGLKININGEYNKSELSDRLLSLDHMTFEDKRYRIELCLEEII